jgi:N-acyl-L-homoserine lactone synthetase
MIHKIFRSLEFWWFQKSFYRRFRFYITKSDSELQELFKLRYQVYCEEYRYLDKNHYPNKIETDEFDNHSIHFILKDRKGNIAATARMIMNSEAGFPIEKHFQINLRVPTTNRNTIAEISRLIVARKYRKKFLLLALIKGMFVFAHSKGISHVYSVLDDKLFPTLSKIGLPFKKIGPTSVYQGLTAPYIMDISEMKEILKNTNHHLYRYLLNGQIKYNNTNNTYSIH